MSHCIERELKNAREKLTVMLNAAIALLCVIATVHSILGEMYVMPHVRKATFPGFLGNSSFCGESLRFTWHLPSIMGATLALILAQGPSPTIVRIIAASLLLSALWVLAVSRGRHPGWAGFTLAAILTWLGAG